MTSPQQVISWDGSGFPVETALLACVRPGIGTGSTTWDVTNCIYGRNVDEYGFDLLASDVVLGQPYTVTYWQNTFDSTGYYSSTFTFVAGLAAKMDLTLAGPPTVPAGANSTYTGNLVQDPAPTGTTTPTLPDPYAVVEIWQRTSATSPWTMATTVKTDVNGHFSAVLPAGTAERQVQARVAIPSGITLPVPTTSNTVTTVVCSGVCPPLGTLTTITPVMQKGSPDIVRAHLTYGSHTAYGTAPIYGGIVTLWKHTAGTTTWAYVGQARTNSSGWTYIAQSPRWWTAYRWTFSGNSRFYGSTSPTVTT